VIGDLRKEAWMMGQGWLPGGGGTGLKVDSGMARLVPSGHRGWGSELAGH